MRVLPRLGLARLRHAQGQRERAFALLAECRELPNTRLDHHFIERIAEIEAHLRLCDGDPQGALVTLPPLHGGRVTLIEVRALAALGEHEAALELLARTDPPGARRAIQAALVQARCLPDEEQRQKALTVAVQLSEQQGYVRILVDERAWLFERLMGLVPTWPTDYVARVIDASAHELAANEPHAPFAPSAQLSGRELEVWRYLATPLSLGEISRRLYISRNTMKTHVRNIYRKLGVATREAAVGVRVTERALPPPEL
jgi:ATP/maltotriose-dependent transcriptional regulator MalT